MRQTIAENVKVWFTATANGGRYREDAAFLAEMAKSLHASGVQRYLVADAPEEADVIIFFVPNQYKGREYARTLLSEKLIQRYPNKCFAVNYDDVPIGFLPGVYVGMPQNKIDHHRFKAGCYMSQYNTLCSAVAQQRDQVQPHFLFSFRGSTSAKVRARIFTAGFTSQEIAIQQTFAWFGHSLRPVGRPGWAFMVEFLDSGCGKQSQRLADAFEVLRT